MELVTHSRLSSLRRCPRLHYYRYELRLVPIREQAPLRMGSVFHAYQEIMNKGRLACAPVSYSNAILAAVAGYDEMPSWADQMEWAVERLTVATMMACHHWRYEADDLTIIAAEQQFELPLVNPTTGARSRLFRLAGKIDGIAQDRNGRVAVLEYKTTGEDIGQDSAYWLRLRCDPQISLYYLAASALGYDVSTVFYDVSKKPTIAPRAVPILDDAGLKIVTDAAGNRAFLRDGCSPRQSASAADGYTLQTRVETPKEFADRFSADVAVRPDYYFARREVPRLSDELETFWLELWQQALRLQDFRRRAAKAARPETVWGRSVGRWTCDGCSYARLCLNNVSMAPGEVPAGYLVTDDPNPELSN